MLQYRQILMVLSFLPFCLNGKGFFITDNQQKFSLNFQLLGNIIVLPLSINGSAPLNFILDTGSPYTIITNPDIQKELKLDNEITSNIPGLGKNDNIIEAYHSNNNQISIGKLTSLSSEILILKVGGLSTNNNFGTNIHGIIGYDLFRDLVVEINYVQKRILFYQHDYFYKKKVNRIPNHEEMDIEIINKKPFLTAGSNFEGKDIELKLLVDFGNSEAIWLFEDENIRIPEQCISDFIGFGLNGEIHGKKSRIPFLKIGSLSIDKPITSFPDAPSIKTIKQTARNGTVGTEFLKRFHMIFDYKNHKLFFKKNKISKRKFQFNMSGMELYQSHPDSPFLNIFYVRENSPAALAGLKKGDIITYVDHKQIKTHDSNQKMNEFSPVAAIQIIESNYNKKHSISLDEIIKLFQEKAGRKVHITYMRGNDQKEHRTSFVLENSI